MALLELSGIAKHFGAIEALKGVDLTIERGEVVGLMGDNGAGKSTLVRVIAGNFRPSEGEIRLDGEVKHFHKPVDARAEGIEVVYQDLALCDNLTAAANVFLGRELKKRLRAAQVLDYAAMYARAAELFDELKSETRPRDLVRADVGRPAPGGGDRAHAPVRCALVLMDEPTAAISVRQVAEVLDLIRRLRDQRHRRRPDQPPHARRVRRLRSRRRPAPRRKVADKTDRPTPRPKKSPA